MTEDKLKALLSNEWERYDHKKMFKLKMVIVVPLLALVYFLLLYVNYLILSYVLPSVTCAMTAIITAVIFIFIVVLIVVKLKQMDVDKMDWYFSCLKDSRLDREECIGMMKELLVRHKFNFVDQETHRTITLFITNFEIAGADFKSRVWFTVIGGEPMVEIGFGPETMINKNQLLQLRTEMSNAFMARFSSQHISEQSRQPPLPQHQAPPTPQPPTQGQPSSQPPGAPPQIPLPP